MTINGFRLGAPDIAYIGAGVTVKGAIVVPDAIVVDGVVEGDVTAQSIRIGPSGAIKGNVISTDVDVSGTLAAEGRHQGVPARPRERQSGRPCELRRRAGGAGRGARRRHLLGL